MAKIEKTLELNITHELLSLADSFWWFLQPIGLRRYWRPYWRFPLLDYPKSYATGLHINLEGKEGGGYDVCINSPSNFQGGVPRLLFMQFKAGEEKPFNTNASSIFHGDAQNEKVHIEFDINSNTKKNQHRLLQELATKAGNNDAVAYVFPRIVTVEQLSKNIGNLLSKTSIISISEMDEKAAENNVTIDDGNAHKFRTCYDDLEKTEINYFFFFFGKQKNPGEYLGEIFAIRMFRALHMLKGAMLSDMQLSINHIIDAMITHLLNLGRHFGISSSEVVSLLSTYSSFQDRFAQLKKLDDDRIGYSISDETTTHQRELFTGIINSLSVYFFWTQEVKRFTSDTTIPDPPKKYSIPLTDSETRLSFTATESENIDEEDFEDIFYQLI